MKQRIFFILILITVFAITFYYREIDLKLISNYLWTSRTKLNKTLNQDFPLQHKAIFKKLNSSQNPSNGCQNKLLIYDANVWICGFGCTLHQITIHLILAYHTNRTLIVRNTNALRYFKPIGIQSDCSIDLEKYKRPSQNYTEDQIIYIYDGEQYMRARTYSLNLFDNSIRNYSGNHKEPYAWLTGHFITYIMQYSDQFKAMAGRFAKQIGFKKNCVGIHRRRTDKKLEAKLFELSEYMKLVDLYYYE
jgi:glycoprotein 6-alpha-L-fucosyltransferase